jgi:toxin ParE1/3/4
MEDRIAIFDYIEADNPRASAATDLRIKRTAEQLARFPMMGGGGRVPGTRELVIARTPYIAVYRIKGESLLILRVLHGARQWPDEFSETFEL